MWELMKEVKQRYWNACITWVPTGDNDVEEMFMAASNNAPVLGMQQESAA